MFLRKEQSWFAVLWQYRLHSGADWSTSKKNGQNNKTGVLQTIGVNHIISPSGRGRWVGRIFTSDPDYGYYYVQHFNYVYRRTGTLWEGRYRATLIDSERYLLLCSRYI